MNDAIRRRVKTQCFSSTRLPDRKYVDCFVCRLSTVVMPLSSVDAMVQSSGESVET